MRKIVIVMRVILVMMKINYYNVKNVIINVKVVKKILLIVKSVSHNFLILQIVIYVMENLGREKSVYVKMVIFKV